MVGASTGIPLADETDAFRRPFIDGGIDPAVVFYFGESVLLPAWRGRGLGHRFFDEREAYARSKRRFACTAFCAVRRADDDVRRPPDYRPLDAFWQQRGYQRDDSMVCRLHWKEIDSVGEVDNELVIWRRPLE